MERWELCYSLRTTQDIQTQLYMMTLQGTARRNLREYSRDIAYKSGDWIIWNRLGNRISNSKWFMEGDSNEILTEIDKKVMERDLRRIKDLSLETGLMGISSYINIRINNADITAIHTNFDDLFLLEWNLICNNKIILDKKQAILQIIGSFPKNEDIHSWEFGLHQGSSGYGLRWILEETPVYSG